MTLEDFYTELTKCKDKFNWQVRDFGVIRADDISLCPLMAVCYNLYPKDGIPLGAYTSAAKMKLDRNIISRIVCAADLDIPNKIRNKMFEILQL